MVDFLRTHEPPEFRYAVEKRSPLPWIISILIVIALIVYFIAQPKQVSQKVEEVSQPPQKAAETPAGPVFKSEAPPFDTKCTVVAGVIPGSIVNLDGKVTFTFKNNGKFTIEGSYFEASNQDIKAYRKNSESLEPGKEITYSIDLNDVSSEVGVMVKSFVVLPIQNDNACLNQRMIVIG
jgi:hypothetical protein